MKSPPKHGMVLVVVLVVIAMLTLAGLTFSALMLAEHNAAKLSANQAQSRAAADSGLEYVRAFLAMDKDTRDQAGGWYSNQPRFQGRRVVDTLFPQGYSKFTVVAPRVDQQQATTTGIRYGLEDESTRLNLNTLLWAEQQAQQAGVTNGGRQILMSLPGMTEDIADSILDWLDSDDQQREFGAEVDYYSSLTPGYAPANGPLTTIEELLLVKGVTPALLFGSDANRNMLADANEPDANNMGVDNSDGSMTRGWSAYLTLWSLESNLRPNGQPKVNLNQSDMQQLSNDLQDALGNDVWAGYIVALRQSNGPNSPKKASQPYTGGQLDLTKAGKYKFSSVLDLIDAQVDVTFVGDQKATTLDSPFPYVPDMPSTMNVFLPTLMDNLTTNPAPFIPGRININQAPRAVLTGVVACVPTLDSGVVDKIVSQRNPDPTNAPPERRQETWLLTEGIVTLDEMKALLPFVTCGGSVYRAQVIGYFDQGGPAVRIEAVIDATSQPPKVVFWRDLSHLGRGYALETLGTEATDR